MFLKIKKLLFGNIGVKQTIIKNTFWLGFAEAVSRISKFFLIVYVARILGATEYGKFTFALAFVGLFIFISNFGINEIVTREFSKDRSKEKQFSSLISLRIFLSCIALPFLLGFSFFITPDVVIRKVIWALFLMVLSHSLAGLFFALLRARQKMQYEAWVRIAEAIFVTGFGFLVLFKFPSIANLGFAYFLAAFLAFLSIVIFFHKKVQPLSLAFDRSIWKNFLKLSWPLAFMGVFSVIYNKIDSVMMGCWGMITETGWYNAAYKITGATLIPAILISQSFYPVLSRAFVESRQKLQKVFNHQLEAMIVLAIPLVTGGIVLARRIIDFIYDPSFFPSIFAFQILIVVAGMFYINKTLSCLLVVVNRQRTIFWTTLSAALLNIILNLILIPHYSLYGAAIATLITFIFIFLLFFICASRFSCLSIFSSKTIIGLLNSVVSSVLMYLVISLPKIFNSNILIIVLVGSLLYVVCFLALQGLAYRLSRKFISNNQ